MSLMHHSIHPGKGKPDWELAASSAQPKITVVMPCFNAEQHLEYGIDSVLKQSFQDFELIVVNDGSTDNSQRILESIDDDRIRIINQANSGVCRARNAALSKSSGEFIAFLDADDTWHLECLETLYNALSPNRTAVLAYCGWQNMGLSGGLAEPFIPPDYEELNKAELLFENCRWPIHAALTRKTAIDKAGFFDERFLTSEDFLLWMKIAIENPIVRVPRVLAYYHHYGEGGQATDDKEKTAINHWLAQGAFIDENPDFVNRLGHDKIRHLMYGELLNRAYGCYWKRDIKAARSIFKAVMKGRYGSLSDWKYMLPSFLPYRLHMKLISLLETSK